MEYTLEVIGVPVSDIDRAKEFYETKCGFHVDIDEEVIPGARVVQLTPPGSGCSLMLGDAIWDTFPGPTPEPGTYHGLTLCVPDIKQAHAELTSRGVDVTEPVQYAERDGATFMYFTDPDGNGWSVQEYRVRAGTPLREAIRP
ncbi:MULTISPECIES: VOC family protein [Streptomyces]|uniref:Glyoxalase n=2 Tax=Streptomyces TaxID=1883 RepID=A0A0W7WXP5_9ACTN|nr:MULTISPECIES: VOC family protein [Streptomyces]KUF15310.1 glyoxalase [Streptomyces silvensis]MVO83965.1 VOC family protein [Streptomyces typhae]